MTDTVDFWGDIFYYNSLQPVKQLAGCIGFQKIFAEKYNVLFLGKFLPIKSGFPTISRNKVRTLAVQNPGNVI